MLIKINKTGSQGHIELTQEVTTVTLELAGGPMFLIVDRGERGVWFEALNRKRLAIDVLKSDAVLLYALGSKDDH